MCQGGMFCILGVDVFTGVLLKKPAYYNPGQTTSSVQYCVVLFDDQSVCLVL